MKMKKEPTILENKYQKQLKSFNKYVTDREERTRLGDTHL